MTHFNSNVLYLHIEIETYKRATLLFGYTFELCDYVILLATDFPTDFYREFNNIVVLLA